MPWRDEYREGMRLKQENRQVEPPHSLILSNESTRDLEEVVSRRNTKVSPETLSHRLEKGWQHLEEPSDPFSNNNNIGPLDLNDNNKLDEDNFPAPPEEYSTSFVDGDYRAMSSDDSDSSSDDDSSASFSDTSPLLDVSSLDNSDVSLDSDMSEDSSSSSSSSSSSDGYMLEDCSNNNNVDEDDDVSIMDAPSMQSSWMSYSSAASATSIPGPSRGQIILPDVLPVGKMIKNDDGDALFNDSSNTTYESVTRNLEITFEKRRSAQDIGAPRMSGDRCLVEITAQPDVQVDIRVNPVSSRSHRETRPISIKHGNTYPREARNNKRYMKNRDISAWIVNDSFDEHYDDKLKTWELDEGIRLNNFTIVNGFKTLSLTELVNPNTNEDTETFQQIDSDARPSTRETLTHKNNLIQLTNSHQNFERNYSKLPANVHMCCKDNWRPQKDLKSAVVKQKPMNIQPISCNKPTPEPSKTTLEKPQHDPGNVKESKVHQETIKQLGAMNAPIIDNNSNKLMKSEKLAPKIRKEGACYSTKKKQNDRKTSAELFEVYTMETALPHINWTSVSKGSKESEWIRKRRNDREEIRRKLAMDSDTEDYISEKLNQHRESSNSFDRRKCTGNLQICFMNEAAKDQDSNPEEESAVEKNVVPTSPKPTSCLPTSTPPSLKSNKLSTVKLRNNNNSPLSVTKRQRPKFFFNRPRSWHASKQDASPFPEEDLLTRHTRLQAEAREALAQAKDMARMQMELEKQKKKKSPIADIVGFPFSPGKTLLTYHSLLPMNVAQLQVIVNDFHSQIETLNEDLVKFLLERDDLHMEQDSMLVDIEDLTRYLGLKGGGSVTSSSQNSVNTAESKMDPKTESVRRSQSVHLKSKNLMWPLHQLALFKEGGHRS